MSVRIHEVWHTLPLYAAVRILDHPLHHKDIFNSSYFSFDILVFPLFSLVYNAYALKELK